jgi:Tat protein secretion system quality control protein TatD with DNase activity
MKKICSRCGEERDVEEDFKWKYKDYGIRQTRCKYCQAKLAKIHYQNNKQTYIKRALARKMRTLLENKPRLYAYLSTHPCVDCGQSDIRVLEFDHVRGQKIGEIGDLFRDGFNWSIIETEIAKCEVRCANCHRIKTFERSSNWRTSQDTQQQAECYQQMRVYLSMHPCIDCGEKDIRLLEFDHVRGHKTANIARLLTQGRSWSTIEAEIAKCEIRCANCHRKRTSERDGDWWKTGEVE